MNRFNKKERNAPNPEWCHDFDWLEIKKINEKYVMFCKQCKMYNRDNTLTKGCCTYKKDVLSKLETIKDHKKYKYLYINQQKINDMFSNKEYQNINIKC